MRADAVQTAFAPCAQPRLTRFMSKATSAVCGITMLTPLCGGVSGMVTALSYGGPGITVWGWCAQPPPPHALSALTGRPAGRRIAVAFFTINVALGMAEVRALRGPACGDAFAWRLTAGSTARSARRRTRLPVACTTGCTSSLNPCGPRGPCACSVARSHARRMCAEARPTAAAGWSCLARSPPCLLWRLCGRSLRRRAPPVRAMAPPWDCATCRPLRDPAPR